MAFDLRNGERGNWVLHKNLNPTESNREGLCQLLGGTVTCLCRRHWRFNVPLGCRNCCLLSQRRIVTTAVCIQNDVNHTRTLTSVYRPLPYTHTHTHKPKQQDGNATDPRADNRNVAQITPAHQSASESERLITQETKFFLPYRLNAVPGPG